MKSLLTASLGALMVHAVCANAVHLDNNAIKHKKGKGKFLVLSDFHMDPFYNTKDGLKPCDNANTSPEFGKFKCDAPMDLVDLALEAAHMALPNPDFIVVLGDYQRHRANEMPGGEHTELSLMYNITMAIERHFPKSKQLHGLEIMTTFGNNDFSNDYYLNTTLVDGSLTWMKKVDHKAWGSLIKSAAQKKSFLHGGFYGAEPLPGLHLLSINTILYSKKHWPKTGHDSDPLGQFAWLRSSLDRVRKANATAYILGHIPPVIDSYALESMWESIYVDQFLDIADEYSDVISSHFFAHFHSDEFRTFDLNRPAGKRSPLLITSSISPIYENNPSFRVFTYNRTTYEPINYAVKVVNLSAIDMQATKETVLGAAFQHEYTALKYFDLKNLSNQEFYRLSQQFLTDNAMWEKFQTVYKAKVPQKACYGECRYKQVCAMNNMRYEDYTACAKQYVAPAPSPAPAPAPTKSKAHLFPAPTVHYDVSPRTPIIRTPIITKTTAARVPTKTTAARVPTKTTAAPVSTAHYAAHFVEV